MMISKREAAAQAREMARYKAMPGVTVYDTQAQADRAAQARLAIPRPPIDPTIPWPPPRRKRTR